MTDEQQVNEQPDEHAIGVIDKYFVMRNDDSSGKHNDCWFFVLDIQHDPIAREALRTYAGEAFDAGFTVLAEELWQRVDAWTPAEERAVPDAMTESFEDTALT